jgi:BASS family bile acid:Na+ symporter
MEIIHRLVELAIGGMIVLFTFGLGLSLGPGALARSVRQRIFWRGLVAALVLVPLFTFSVVWLLNVPSRGAALLLLMGVCPGAVIMINQVRKRSGDVALAAALSLTLTVAAILLMPVSLAALNRVYGSAFHVNPVALFGRAALPVLISTGIGLTIARFMPRAAGRAFPIVMALFKALLAIALVVILAKALPSLTLMPLTLFAAVVVTIGAAAIGRSFGGEREADRVTMSITAAEGNPALVLAIVQVSYPEVDALPLVGCYLIVRAITLVLYLAWTRRPSHRDITGSHGHPSPEGLSL